ncbi:MAG: DUF3570 domain-containing protein [Nevskiaceae bacterium]|jgi:hypothetical protein|nr:DUF3570 domain-containing protein [Nevskiaceae bacterium]
MTVRALRLLLILLLPIVGSAAVLEEDRADVMYHSYDGGGVTVQGPSVLVRKKFGERFAASANYYVDAISSASIDVVTTASPYSERREQKSVGAEYLQGKTVYTLNYTNSEENDYQANTVSAGLSQDLFGDLTTVTLGFSRGWDVVENVTDPEFRRNIDRRNYRVGVTQVLTRNMLLALNFETITEQGYLQNPYRSMRYAGPEANSYTRAPEIFPGTRTGNAGSGRLKVYLPWRAAAEGMYRFYTDTWDIRAHTAEIAYTQPVGNRWTFTGSYRFYTQNSAAFYSDLFPRADYQNFMARDKENASYTGNTIGVGASYALPVGWAAWLKRGELNLRFNHMMIDYDDFRDLRNYPPGAAEPGTEPLYSLNANILQVFVSFWF